MRSLLPTLLALAATALPSVSAHARDPALIGVERLQVTVELPPDELIRFGLTQALLEEAVREGLGTRFGTPEETKDVARLHLDLNLTMYNFYSWGVRLEVERALSIEGQPGAFTRRVVWSTGRLGGTLLPQEARRLADVARELAQTLRSELAK